MYVLLTTLWFVWEVKYGIFWLYLWQLKDYHIGRFTDHFRTHRGRKLIFNFIQILKIVLFFLFFAADGLFVYIFSILLLTYLAESALFLRSILNGSVKRPVITSKILFLSVIFFLLVFLFLSWISSFKDSVQPALLLEFDILTALIISLIVLIFQPIFVLVRNNTLRKAAVKLEKIKAVSKLKVIAITGSYGKTSTKEFLATILSKKYRVLKTNEHQNSEIGVAKCILQDLKPSHQIFIAEVGAYNKGKVKEVCSMIKPEIGIVTGVNEQHLALFGSLENLLSAEGGEELADALPQNGLLVVNADNKYCLDLYNKVSGKNRKVYSFSNKIIDADIWSDNIEVAKNYISFTAMDRSKEFMHFNVRVLGKQNVQNLLGAILIAKELGMDFGQIADACKNISQKQAGIVLKNGKHGIYVVDSSYSANPDGVYADLDYFSVFKGKRAMVMPCLIELGGKSAAIHEKIGRKIAEVCDLAIITSKDRFKEVKKGAIEAGMPEKNILLCDKTQDIYSAITLFCKSGDAVLLEGRVPKELIKLLAA
jgi:UDP-N-acetylmuramoyl-tripeptide--D-alanyl-D-alanine ligase